jgi:hypothetical protein
MNRSQNRCHAFLDCRHNIHIRYIKHAGKNLELEFGKHLNGRAQVMKCGQVTQQTRLFRHISATHNLSVRVLFSSKIGRQLTALPSGWQD